MTDHDARLRAALRPTDTDRQDADRIVDAILAGEAAPRRAPESPDGSDGPDGPHRGERRRPTRRWLVPAAAAASVALLVAAVGVWRPFEPEPDAASTAPIASTAPTASATADAPFVVACAQNGSISLSTDRVIAAPDGAHVRVENRTGPKLWLSQRHEGDGSTSPASASAPHEGTGVEPGSTDVVLQHRPGQIVLRCGDGQAATVPVQDPHAYYRGDALDLRCSGTELALDVPDESAGRGQTPQAALIDLAKKHQGTRTTDARFIYLGYRDAPVGDALIALPDGSHLRTHIVTEKEPTGTAPGTYTARPDASSSTGYERTPTAAPTREAPVVTRSGTMTCPDAAQPSWAVGPGYGPTPQQAAESLTAQFGDGRLRDVSHWPDLARAGGGQAWAMEVDGRPVITIDVRPTTSVQAAYAQGYEAHPDSICSMSALQELSRGG